MDGSNSKQVCAEVLKALERAIRCSQPLPRRDELQLIRVTSSELKEKGNKLTEQVLSEIKSVASRYAVSILSSDSDSCSSHTSGSLSLRDSMFDQTAETTDEALQHFNIALDRARKISIAVVPPQGALCPKTSAPRVGIGNLGRSHGSSLDIEKPQIHFPDYPIDNSDAPFVAPYARDHYSDPANLHANKRKTPSQNVETYLRELYKKNSNPDIDQRHPYENEIVSSMQEMSTKEFKLEQVTVYKSMQSTPCTFVSTEEELFNVVERLKKASAIAVDIENHSVRSFQGFTCLIQISTRKEDFVIDALRLRGSIHRALAPIFTDEATVKVLHGADRDVQWLERDFGIYVVNMFDTGQAARLLKLPSASLAFLLSHFCDVSGSSKKKFQLADWRQRPLPKEMFKYARSDTHYLLYIFDRLRCELSNKRLLGKAWERSAIVSRKRHRKARFEPGIAKHLAARHCLGFDNHQLRLLEELCKWRDTTAREEDESFPYVAPLEVLFGIVRARDKARSVEGLLKHGFPGGIIPPLVYQNAKKLTELIGDALDAKIDGAADDKCRSVGHSEELPVQKQDDLKDKSVLIKARIVAEGQPKGSVGSSSQSSIVPETGASFTSSGTSGVQAPTKKQIVSKQEKELLSEGPKLKVISTSKSALLDSESESDSDSVGHVECSNAEHLDQSIAPNIGKGVEYIRTGELYLKDEYESEGHGSKAVWRVGSPECITERDEFSEGKGKGEVESLQPFVRAANHSIFDLSDNSDDEQQGISEEATDKHSVEDKIASAKAEIAKDQAQRQASLILCADTDGAERNDYKKKIKRDIQPVEERTDVIEEVISLREEARRAESSGSKKRKRKEKLKPSQEQPLPIPAFDYENAIAREEQKKKAIRRPDQYDPMRKLRGEREPGVKRRVKKRRRGRAQSMSFKAR